MPYHLIAVRGPMRGMSFTLSEGEVSMGRGESNLICVPDIHASRRHCAIRNKDEQFTIVDLGSQNGTFVNGLLVTEEKLKLGDRVEVGASVFVFAGDEQPKEERNHADSSLAATTSRKDSADYPDLPLPVLLKLSGILDCIRALYSVIHERDQQAYQRLLLTLVFDIVPADRGAVVIQRGGRFDAKELPGWDRRFGEVEDIGAAQGVIEGVIAEGAPILSNGIDQRFILCVPLASRNYAMGAIYLETSNGPFRDEDSQLMIAIARIAAVALENAQQMEWLEWQNRQMEEASELQHGMLGKSACMQEVYEFVARVAPTDSTVLICGESGTGKELVARAIHANSNRRAEPFITLNCAAFPEALIESELFGYEKGAFTGAVAQKKGILEVADQGTVFLDEIGELPISQQAKLLRAIDLHEFVRIGSSRTSQVDVRIIAATNRDLHKAANDGTFRSDLYYRINVVSIKLPPLRRRREDIPTLSSYFLEHFSTKYNSGVKSISRRAQLALSSYDWPGNVRELQNAIERAVVLGTMSEIQPEDLPDSVLESQPSEKGVPDFHNAVREQKKELIKKAISDASGSFTEAAKLLGVHPNYLHRLVTNLGLRTHVRERNS